MRCPYCGSFDDKVTESRQTAKAYEEDDSAFRADTDSQATKK